MDVNAYREELARRDHAADQAYCEAFEEAILRGVKSEEAVKFAEQAEARVYECWEIDPRDFEE